MAHVRKITWQRKAGGAGKAFKLTYVDAKGERHSKNFETKSAADSERIRVEGQLANGIHIPDKDSLTVLRALEAWLDHLEKLLKANKRDISTLTKYRQHVRSHIEPYSIARAKLSRLRTPDCQAFVDEIGAKLSHKMTLKVRATLKTGLSHARRQGWIAFNPVDGTEIDYVDREDDEVIIPARDEVIRILAAAEAKKEQDNGLALAMLMVGFFGGPRPSELLGLERPSLTLTGNRPKFRISQRVNMHGQIWLPKRKASHREVQLGPRVVAVLRDWVTTGLKDAMSIECVDQGGSRRRVQMLFPGEQGRPMTYFWFRTNVWTPVLEAAGLATKRTHKAGKGVRETTVALYPPNVMRHFAASVWIDQRILPKALQKRIGHASIQTTMDVYGHLFIDLDQEQDQVAAAEDSVFSAKKA